MSCWWKLYEIQLRIADLAHLFSDTVVVKVENPRVTTWLSEELNMRETIGLQSIPRVRKSGTFATARWRNFSHYCRPLRHYDVWFTCSHNREVLTAAPTAHGVHTQAFRVRHWTSREASLRHSSGWGTESFPLSSVICAPVVYTDSCESGDSIVENIIVINFI